VESLLASEKFCSPAENAARNEGFMNSTAKAIIEKLNLSPLPFEGGYFRRTYESGAARLPARDFGIEAASDRASCTAIYYLVTPEDFSALHRVRSDELFHFYAGDAVEMVQIDLAGKLIAFAIGSDVLAGELPQVLVPKNFWQGLRLKAGGEWCLMGTTVSPGFEYEDFELGERATLTAQYPKLVLEIARFTRS
jgi:predicted cupin superfamily sugar epimerase